MMKTHLKKLALFGFGMILWTPCGFAQGGSNAGNGGNGMVCFDDAKIARLLTAQGGKVVNSIPDEYISHITSIETLDLVEAKQPVGFDSVQAQLKPMLVNETPQEFVARIIRSVSYSLNFQQDPNYDSRSPRTSLGQIIEAGKNSMSTVKVYTNQALFAANDISPLVNAGEKCIYSTIAKQRSVGDSKIELAIDGRLFNHPKHSHYSKAVLLLHEYALAASQEKRQTEGVRELVSTLIQANQSMGKIIEVANRRALFGPLDTQIYLNSVSEKILAAQATLKTQYRDLIARANPEFSVASKNLYEKMPKWWRVYVLSLDIDYAKCQTKRRGNRWSYELYERCLKGGNEEDFNRFIALRDQFLESRVLVKFRAIQKDILDRTLADLNAELISSNPEYKMISSDLLERLKIALKAYFTAGIPNEYQYAQNGVQIRFGKIEMDYSFDGGSQYKHALTVFNDVAVQADQVFPRF